MGGRGRAVTGTAVRTAPVRKIAYEDYVAAVQTDGPQIRGYQPQDYACALADKKTRRVTIQLGASRWLWPVLTDIRHDTEFISSFFQGRYGAETPVYYLSLPSAEQIGNPAQVRASLLRHLRALAHEGACVVVDEHIQTQTTIAYIRDLITSGLPGASIEEDEYADPSDHSPAQIVHVYAAASTDYEPPDGKPIDASKLSLKRLRDAYTKLVAQERKQHAPPRSSIIIGPDKLDRPLRRGAKTSALDQIWAIYESRFHALHHDYPWRGEQTRDELESMLRDKHTLTIVNVRDGRVAAFTYLIDVRHCDWLNQAFYARRYTDGLLMYSPGIAADEAYEGLTSIGMTRLLCQLVRMSVPRIHVVFQCTNISSQYLPKIIETGMRLGRLRLDTPIEPMAIYRCVGLRLRMP